MAQIIWGTNLPLTLALPALKCGGKDLEAAVILALVWAKLPREKEQYKPIGAQQPCFLPT